MNHKVNKELIDIAVAVLLKAYQDKLPLLQKEEITDDFLKQIATAYYGKKSGGNDYAMITNAGALQNQAIFDDAFLEQFKQEVFTVLRNSDYTSENGATKANERKCHNN